MKRVLLTSVLLIAVAAPAYSFTTSRFHVSPAVQHPGSAVRISATSTLCLPGDQIFLISKAFPGNAFGAEGALVGQVRARGAFSVAGHLRHRLKPGRYAVTFRCGGGVLPRSAHLIVR